MRNLFASACRWFCAVLLCTGLAWAQDVTLTARVELLKSNKTTKAPEAENVVVWLVPEGGGVRPAAFQQNQIAQNHVSQNHVSQNQVSQVSSAQVPRLVQYNKTFEPHVLVVPVGSVVAFPTRDPFFHNVFSLFEGKRFTSACTKPAPSATFTLTNRESLHLLQYPSRDERRGYRTGHAVLRHLRCAGPGRDCERS